MNNFSDFPDIIEEGEQVVISEKIKGCLTTISVVEHNSAKQLMANGFASDFEVINHQFGYLSQIPEVMEMLNVLSATHKQVIVFGESYEGQTGKYTKHTFPSSALLKVFDILVDGQYLSFGTFAYLTVKYHVPTVRFLYLGRFHKDLLQLANNKSTLDNSQMMDSIVIKPVTERTHPDVGRVILQHRGQL